MNKLALSGLLSLSLLAPFKSAFAAAGGLDPGFGNGGIVDTHFGNNVNNFRFSDAASQTNGDILVAGAVSFIDGTQATGIIVRYLPTGTLDASFGSGGTDILHGTSATISVSVQSDGKILVLTGVALPSPGVRLLRLLSNGQLDPTFGSGGSVVINFPAPPTFSASPNLVMAQPDGKIVLAGSATPPRHSTLSPQTVLARYLSSGAPDVSFGNAGIVEIVAVSAPSAIALLSSGDIVAVKQSLVAQFTSTGARVLNPTGGLVVATKRTGSGNTIFLPNGQYLIARTAPSPVRNEATSFAQVNRFTVSGALDSSFHSPLISYGNIPLTKSTGTAIGVDAQGRIVVGGGRHGSIGDTVFGLARLNATGDLDTTFGVGGSVTTQVALSGSAFFTLVQPDSKPVSMGDVLVARDTTKTTVDLALVRYLAQ